MSRPFELWSDRIAAAADDEARRALLAEAAQWRAQHLNDVAATRRATFAMSRLYGLIGDRDRAVAEARQLLSLCRTAPEAPDEEVDAAVGWLRALGENPPPLPPRTRGRDRFQRDPRDRGPARAGPPPGRRGPDGDRPPRERAPRPERRDPPPPREAEGGRRPRLEDAREAARAGRHADVLHALDGAQGAGASLLRAHAALSLALAAPEDERARRLGELQAELARAVGVGAHRQEAGDDPLSALLGAAVPHARGPRIRAIESFAEAHPERVDTLAAAALRHHVAVFGPRSAAPWLVGVAAQALATGTATATPAAIAELRAQGALAVEAYDEWAFERLVRVVVRARELGHTFVSLRRGVVARGEPDDRKVWTLRLRMGDDERMLAVAPHATLGLEEGRAEEIAARLAGLSPRTALLATGSGNDALRRSAAAHGAVVVDRDADDDALLGALASALPHAALPQTAAHAEGEPPTAKLADVLAAEPLDEEALAAVVAGFRRPDRLLRIAQRLDLDDRKSAALLRALDRSVESGRTVPEATTLAVRAAVAGEATRGLLTAPGSPADRFGGPGIGVVVDLARALAQDGWDVHRVLRGATRRETTAHPALDTLGPHLGGLWRLLVRRGGIRGEVWLVGDLPAEGRAAVPLLLLEPWQRVVVVPVDDPSLLAWYRSIGGPDPIGWTGAEGGALREAVASFVPQDAPAEVEGGPEAVPT